MRTLLNGYIAEDLEKPVTITIKTKAPKKWLIVDLETGEVYTPTGNEGYPQFQKYLQDDPSDKDIVREAIKMLT